MFILVPLVWLIAWLVVAGLVAAFSGLSSHGAGLVLFFCIFGGGGIALPVLGGLGWMLWRRLRNR